MTIPPFLLGIGCVVWALLLTFVFPIQRGRLQNQLWDFITLVLFIAGAYFINYFDMPSNFILGALSGFVAVLIRDVRLWWAQLRSQTYRRGHWRWYGRARDWYSTRRRRR